MVAGGTLGGRLALDRNGDGMKLEGEISLAKADAAQFFAGQARAPVSGRIASEIEFRAAGLSAEALIGSMTGSGTITLERALMANLDPKVFSIAIADVDQGIKPDLPKVTEIAERALSGGYLSVPSAEGAIMIGAGQVRVSKLTAQAQGADLGLTGRYDLLDGRLDARVTLTATSAPQVDDVEPPAVYVSLHGPFAAPARNIDASALMAWLTLRAVEQQSKRLQALEKARRDAALEAARQPAADSGVPSAAAAPAESSPQSSSPQSGPPQSAPPSATSTGTMAPSKPSSVKPAQEAGSRKAAPHPASRHAPSSHPASAPVAAARETRSGPARRAPSLPPPVEIKPAPKTHSAGRANRGGASDRVAPPPPGMPLSIMPFPFP
jgi:large subunit ribosomal protein L24